MLDFSDAFLQPERGIITYWPTDVHSPAAGTWSMEIPLKPFSADDKFEPVTFRPGAGGPLLIETEISLDFIELPAKDLTRLSGQSLAFPTNPHDGYIDGSIYLIACHCPVEVTAITFGVATDDQIAATIHAWFDFDRPGGIDIANRTADLDVILLLAQP